MVTNIEEALDKFMSGPLQDSTPNVRSMARLAFLCGAYADYTVINYYTSMTEEEAVPRVISHEHFLKAQLTPEKIGVAVRDINGVRHE